MYSCLIWHNIANVTQWDNGFDGTSVAWFPLTIAPLNRSQTTVPFRIYRPSQVTDPVVMVDFGTLSPVTPETVEGRNRLRKRGFLLY
jgi:hypothetical protein